MNKPVTKAINEFVAALEIAGYPTDELQIVLPLNALTALYNEVTLTRGRLELQDSDIVRFTTPTGYVMLKVVD